MGILIAGYYGYRNWGDEGSLATLLQVLPRESVCALSGDPAFTEATYGIRALPRMEIRAVRRAVRESDALILGGGSLLQDATSLRSLLYYLALIRWGLRAHGRVLLVGQGVGPLRRRIGRRLAARLLRRVPFLSVRDADSARLLESLGVSGATVDADLTWALAPQPAHVALDARARWVGLAPRPWGDAPVKQAFADLCRRLHADGYRALLIPMQESQDRALCEAIAAESGAETLPMPHHPAHLLGVMAQLEAVIAVRLHGAIFAASAGVPVLCVSYDPKVDALAAQLGAPTVPPRALQAGLVEAWAAFPRDALRARLQETVPALQQTAQHLLARVQESTKPFSEPVQGIL
jgi:polysaccharide pyruvyl transferase CsaB